MRDRLLGINLKNVSDELKRLGIINGENTKELQEIINNLALNDEALDAIDLFIRRCDKNILNGETISNLIGVNSISLGKFGETFTPKDLVCRMIKILYDTDNNIFNEKSTFLDLCCGSGIFLVWIAKCLIILGYEKENIAKRLYGIDISLSNVKLTRKYLVALLGKENENIINKNIREGDSLNFNWIGEFGMKKFDVIIGNPPYQAPKKITGKKKGTIGGDLWSKFVEKSLELAEDGGYISLIHPPMWRKPEHKIWDLLTENQIKYLEIHSEKDGSKTFGAQTKFDWYVVQKTPYKESTKIIDEEGVGYSLNLNELPFIPNYNFEDFGSILAKDDEEKCEVIYSRSIYGTDKKWMNEENTKEFKYPCVYGMKQNNIITYWYSNCNDKGHFNIPKVILGWGRHLYPLIDFEGKYGMTQIVFGIKIDSLEEGENIKKAIETDKFKRILACSKWGAFQTEWRMFKYFRKDFWKEFI